VSTLAREQRRTRRKWAVAGGSHDRLIGTLRLALPTAIGVLTAFLMVAPIAVGNDISFVLSKKSVDIAPERMRVSRAVYRGRDEKDEPFRLTADSAVQQTSQTPIVHLKELKADIQLTNGPATIVSNQGRYDMDTSRIALDGPVKLDEATGYHLTTSNILLDMKTKIARSQGAVTGTMPLGNYSADHMRADFNARTVQLVGRARLHIVQGKARGGR
jgi:lipopolysaccharide export system protein LptC